jgi:GLPGLI family protein
MKSLFTLVLSIASLASFAQKDFQGKATYMSKTTMDMDSWGNGQVSDQQKKQIAERMKSMLEKTFILSFDKIASLYKEDEKLAAPTAGGGGFSWGGFGGGGTNYKNVRDGKAIEAIEFLGKEFLVTEDLEKPEWELSGETRQIGDYLAYKATMMKETDAMDWSNMRRRNRDDDKNKKNEAKTDTTKVKVISDDIEMPKQILVTAWYTPQIPVSNGPGEYWGLPGLILEVSSGRTTVLCTEIVLNPSEKISIEAPNKGEKMDRKEYTELVKTKMEEMRERFQGRGGRGGRG